MITIELLLRKSLLLVLLNMLNLLDVRLTLVLYVLLLLRVMLRLMLRLHLLLILLSYHRLGSGKNLGRLGKRIRVEELWVLLTQNPMDNLVSHAVVPD